MSGKNLIAIGEAALKSPIAKEAVEQATTLGAKLFEGAFGTATKSGAKAAAGVVEREAAQEGGAAAASQVAKGVKDLFANPKNDKAVMDIINGVEKPMQENAAKIAKELGVPVKDVREAITQGAQDSVLKTRLDLVNKDIAPKSVADLQRHLERSGAKEIGEAFKRFIPGRAEAVGDLVTDGIKVSGGQFENVVQADRVRVVEEALKKLRERSPRAAEAVENLHLDGLSRVETAKKMGISGTAVDFNEARGLGIMARDIKFGTKAGGTHTHETWWKNGTVRWDELY